MTVASETADTSQGAVAPSRRPTVLLVRAAEAPDTGDAMRAAVGNLATVMTLVWTGALDAASLSALIAERLADHDVVLHAQAAMADPVLAATAPQIRRVVVIDPPGDLPLSGRPTDVVLRAQARPAPALAAAPSVRVHAAARGVSVYEEDVDRLIAEVVREACRLAAPDGAPGAAVLDAPLLDATPLTGGAVGYLGPEGDAFVAAYAARQPAARPQVLSDAPGEPLDILVLGAPVAEDRLGPLIETLKPGGWLVARWCAAGETPQALRRVLEAHGLSVAGPVDHGGTGVFRAQRAAATAAPFTLVYSAISPWMMDIRTRLPMRQMASDPDLVLRYLVPMRSIPPASRDQPKIVVMQRPARTGVEFWRETMASLIARGWMVVIEYDDHPLLVAEVAGLEPSEELFERLGFVHGVQTSVAPLAELFSRYNPEIAIFPNAVFELLPFPQTPPSRRVFYGATPRGQLPAAVARSLDGVAQRFPDIEFVVVGSRAVFDALPTGRKTFHPYLTYESYLDVMATCSISLTPIDALEMHETKSDAKFLDASRAGLLTIASPTIYRRTIRHGENGLIADTLDDWAPLLTQALADPDAARRMARRAWDEMRTGRMFVHQMDARKAWYLDLWARRDALNAALMNRLPGLREAVDRLLGG